MRNKTCLVLILFYYFVIMKQKFMNYYFLLCSFWHTCRGFDKSLARPGRKQATATEDFEFHISYLLV